MQEKYFSQHKQDEVLDKVIFQGKKKGFFLDIGANDGVTYSNTYFQEINREWTGICVEPLPDTFRKLKESRRCILENCAVGKSDGHATFLAIEGYGEMLSGLKNNYTKKHLERIDSEIATYGGNKKEIEIVTKNVNTMLASHGVKHIDYCNIDTEGSELTILKAIDFSKVQIDVITVEANYDWDRFKLRLLLTFKGYKYICSLGNDMVFVHSRTKGTIADKNTIRNRINNL
jgi:FkbM family methyltransferase